MIRRILCFLVIAGVCGCSDNKQSTPESAPTTTPAPKPAEPVAEKGQTQTCCTLDSEYISFVTVYTMPLKNDRVLKIKAKARPWLDEDIEFSDELRQKDGRWVIFDCDHIADRILIPGLPEEIAPYCKSIHKQAAQFWSKHHYKPDEFVDGGGTHWRKQP